MIENLDGLLSIAEQLYPEAQPRPFKVLGAVRRVSRGEDLATVARAERVTASRLTGFVSAPDPVEAVLGVGLAAVAGNEKALARARGTLGQLLLGQLAERAFEAIYKSTMGTNDLVLEDDRSSRTDTDYRVVNGQSRPVFRINIKFHGTLFRNARQLVSLDPEDCFALATYKIHMGLQKQEQEVLPYLFVIVSVPGVTGASVGGSIPEDLAHFMAVVNESGNVSGKREIEERIVERLIDAEDREPFRGQVRGFIEAIEKATWRVISARRADRLLKEKLFERVYAVRVRAFARNYRNAELDMHFSLRDDLKDLQDFLALLKTHGLHGLTARLERGDV